MKAGHVDSWKNHFKQKVKSYDLDLKASLCCVEIRLKEVKERNRTTITITQVEQDGG